MATVSKAAPSLVSYSPLPPVVENGTATSASVSHCISPPLPSVGILQGPSFQRLTWHVCTCQHSGDKLQCHVSLWSTDSGWLSVYAHWTSANMCPHCCHQEHLRDPGMWGGRHSTGVSLGLLGGARGKVAPAAPRLAS